MSTKTRQGGLSLMLAAIMMAHVTWLAASPAQAQDAVPEGLPESYNVTQLAGYVDVDTIQITLDGTTAERDLIGVAGLQPGECYFDEAVAAVTTLLPVGMTLYAEIDINPVDSEGREQRHVWADAGNGEAYLVNSKLIRDGLAGWDEQDSQTGNDRYDSLY